MPATLAGVAADATTDEALMAAYVAGDQQAFDVLFDRYAPMLLRVTRRHLDSDEQAQEIVQETFVRLHAARRDFRTDARLRPWIMTIAMNLVRGYWRKKKRRKTDANDQVGERAAPMPDKSEYELKQRATLLREALDQLPASQREVVELHWFQERPFAEVAHIVGSSEGAVRVRAHRAYKTLRALLGHALEGS